MSMSIDTMLFRPLQIKSVLLKNRITMAPMFTGYANKDGTVSTPMIEHYRNMAASGVAMVVVESAAIDPSGLASPYTLRLDDRDFYLEGLSQLAAAIHEGGALAFLQINHAGRFATLPHRIAPSSIDTHDELPIEMTRAAIERVVALYAEAASLVKESGFDGVEIHGAAGYLLVQFLSPHTNRRSDEYGGAPKNRMRFPIEVVEAVQAAVGADYPVGYRFLADEYLPHGLHPDETLPFAEELARRGVAYLSVTAGTYDSFYSPEYKREDRREAFLAHFARMVKERAPDTPVIAAGRIQSPERATAILEEGSADMIGLARVLFADPLWPKKAAGIQEGPIIECGHDCSLCTRRALIGFPAFCARWDKANRREWLDRVKEIDGVV